MLSIGSGGTGGVYYPLGGWFANLLSAQLSGYQVTSCSCSMRLAWVCF